MALEVVVQRKCDLCPADKAKAAPDTHTITVFLARKGKPVKVELEACSKHEAEHDEYEALLAEVGRREKKAPSGKRSVDPEAGIPCKKCDYVAKTQGWWDRHMETKHGVKKRGR